jgi:transposase
MRNKPVKSPMERYTVRDFEKQFPNDDICLEWLKDFLYPDGIHCDKCQKVTPHYKVASRKSYSCQFCGHHVHPTAGTIYHKSSTPLRLWFKAVFLMSSTRCGIAAKQLERELGVTYKTAWRMFHQIRSMLSEDKTLTGTVEVDETYVGGYKKGGKPGFGARDHKTIVAGAVERKGSVIAKVVPNVKSKTLTPFVKETVSKDATIYTDELHSYNLLYAHCEKHETIHHRSKQWVKGDVHTNSIEGFWSLLKGGIRGAYRGRVTKAYMQNYINEFAFRYNRRNDVTPMFLSFLQQVQKLSD